MVKQNMWSATEMQRDLRTTHDCVSNLVLNPSCMYIKGKDLKTTTKTDALALLPHSDF